MQDETALAGLARLREPLPQQDAVGLESVDPRLALLNQLCEKDQLRDLVSEADQLLEAGIYDIRPISMYLWAAFAENGLTALTPVFETLTALATTNFQSIGPSHKRAEHFCKRVSWLAQKITNAIEYHEARQTPEWTKWTTGLGNDVLETALERTTTLEHALEITLEERYATVKPSFQKLTARLRVVSMTFRIPSTPAVSIAAPVIASLRPPTHSQAQQELQVDARLGRAEVGVSHEFFSLIQKLEAFSKLVKKNDLARAAVVADDLMRTIEAFDPRLYFPELFSDFSELLSKHIDTLASHWRERESTAWKAHAQFYRVDLKRFVGGG